MNRYRVWLVLLVLVVLAVALVLLLMPRKGGLANIAFEPQDAHSNRPARTEWPAQNETPSPAPVPNAETETPKAPATPQQLAVPTWEPLPPIPAPRFRKLTMADLGMLDDAEVARRRARVATLRFKVTIRGQVRDLRGEAVAGARVWAHSMGVCGPNRSSEDSDFNLFRIQPPSEPSGEATSDETGEYALVLQVTGADVEDLLRAVDAEEKSGRGQYQAQAIVRAQAGEKRSNGVGVLALRPDAVIEGVSVTVHEAPMATFVVRDKSGQPVPCAHLNCRLTRPMEPGSGPGSTYNVYADEAGVIHLPREDGWQYTMMTNNGFGTGRRVFGPMAEEYAKAPIALDVASPLEAERAVVFRAVKEGTSEPPASVMYAMSLAALEASPATEGWLLARHLPDAGKELVLFAADCGTVHLTVPDIRQGHCAEFDSMVFPASRPVQLRLVDEGGKPVVGARIEGRIIETLRMRPAPTSIEHLPEGGLTDSHGRVNVQVMPGRPYRLMATVKSGETSIKRDWTFTGPGPHEWRIAEAGK